MVTTLENNDLIGWMRKNNRAARAARTKHNSAPQKEKNLSKSTKALKKVLQILQLQFVLEKTSRREDICLQTLTSHFICQSPNIRTLVGTLQEQIAIGDVTDIIDIYFLLLNTDVLTFRVEMLFEVVYFFVKY